MVKQERQDSRRVKKGSRKMGNEAVRCFWYVYIFGHAIEVRVGFKWCKILLTMFVFDVLMI